MPTDKTIDLSIYKAEKTGTSSSAATCVQVDIMTPLARKTVVITDISQIATIAEAFASDYNHGTAVLVSLAKGQRKPPGFDAATRDLYYNLQEAPKPPPPTAEEVFARAAHRATVERRNAEPTEYLSCAETAKLVRTALKKGFPAVKFSVRSHTYAGGASIDVRYVNGPTARDVETIANQFRGGGFDGSIDLAYGVTHWLMADGTTTIAYTPGSSGSGGHDESIDTMKPDGAVKKVHFGADFVFVYRKIEPALMDAKCAEIAAQYGTTGDAFIPEVGDYVSTLAHRFFTATTLDTPAS